MVGENFYPLKKCFIDRRLFIIILIKNNLEKKLYLKIKI